MAVADVPAGGGYLRRHLPAGCAWLGHEPCGSFGHRDTAHASSSLLPLPWPDGSMDAAISLAGVHHLDDKAPFFAEIKRILRPGGRFVLSDVEAGTPAARFLDGFVGRHNSTGHAGAFLDAWTEGTLREAGWHVVSTALARFHWAFPDRTAMAAFCRELFDIGAASASDVGRAIEALLGVDGLPGGGIGLRWSLRTIVACKPLE